MSFENHSLLLVRYGMRRELRSVPYSPGRGHQQTRLLHCCDLNIVTAMFIAFRPDSLVGSHFVHWGTCSRVTCRS